MTNKHFQVLWLMSLISLIPFYIELKLNIEMLGWLMTSVKRWCFSYGVGYYNVKHDGGIGQKTAEDKIQAMVVASISSTSEFLGK